MEELRDNDFVGGCGAQDGGCRIELWIGLRDGGGCRTANGWWRSGCNG